MIVIRDLSYSLPELSTEWKEAQMEFDPTNVPKEWKGPQKTLVDKKIVLLGPQIEQLLLSTDQHIIWMAEYNSACINALKKKIGAKDKFYWSAKSMIPKLQEAQGVLSVYKYLQKGVVEAAIDMIVNGCPNITENLNLSPIHQFITDAELR